MKILIAVDESPHSRNAVVFVTRMRWPAGSRIIVMSVVQAAMSPVAATFEPPTLSPVPEFGAVIKATRDVVDAAQSLLRDAGFATETRIAEAGDPREMILEVAKSERIDLIVMGSHGRTGLARLMLGSVSSHVVTHAPCSVLVVKKERPK
jgi:nucleotide-binding universal stress UspA family protein